MQWFLMNYDITFKIQKRKEKICIWQKTEEKIGFTKSGYFLIQEMSLNGSSLSLSPKKTTPDFLRATHLQGIK